MESINIEIGSRVMYSGLSTNAGLLLWPLADGSIKARDGLSLKLLEYL